MQRWFSFEEEIRLLVEEFGYRGVCTPKVGDHGVDVLAEKNGRKVAVQVKLFESTKVGNQTVIMLLGGMQVYGATEALLITTGRLTRKAEEACRNGKVAWYDGNRLRALCVEHSITLPSWCHFASHVSRRALDTAMPQVVGRDPACTIPILTDLSVSRRHFELRRTGLRLFVVDLGSTNGTLVNGMPIKHKAVLKYGDKVQAGNQTWSVIADPSELNALLGPDSFRLS